MSSWYIVKEGLAGFKRAKLSAIGSALTIATALVLLGSFHVVSTNTSRIIGDIQAKVEIEAFLEQPLRKNSIIELNRQIMSVDGVFRVEYVSKEKAALIFKEEFGEDIHSILDFNPLPPSFKVVLMEGYHTAERVKSIARQIGAIRGIDEVVYQKELLETLEKRTSTVYLIGLSLGVLLGISAMFLVSNTIRLTIYSRRKIIETMKLVGATRWFVRAPFLIEGLVQGLAGGIVAAGVLYVLLSFVSSMVSTELSEFARMRRMDYGLVVAAGALLGLLGSIFSIRRFLGDATVLR